MMDANSPLFDRIRVRPRGAPRIDEPTPAAGRCDQAGCREPGAFRAPMGRGREGQFWHFCLDHVRAYNQTYNYFAGMAEDAVDAYQKDASTGHRPTWTMGVNPGSARGRAARQDPPQGPTVDDPFGMFGPGRRRPAPEPERRRLSLAERRAYETLDMPEHAPGPEVKARYKTLVKRLHPDANGGDRSCEEKLRTIIQAYNTLRTAGLC